MSECVALKCAECGTEDHVFRSMMFERNICWDCREKLLSEKDPVYATNVRLNPKFSLKRFISRCIK